MPCEDVHGGPLDYPGFSDSVLCVCTLKAVELEGLVVVGVEHVDELRGWQDCVIHVYGCPELVPCAVLVQSVGLEKLGAQLPFNALCQHAGPFVWSVCHGS